MHQKAKVLSLIVPVVILVVGLVLYTSLNDADITTESNLNIKRISIKLTETFNEEKVWVPSTIYLKKGDNVEFTIINGDDDDHILFLIPDLGVTSDVISPLNGQRTVTFTVHTVGEYLFNHVEACDPWEGGSIEECDAEEESDENAEDESSIHGLIIVEE